ncbi:universal stress protein [Nocardia sp. NPDC003979]
MTVEDSNDPHQRASAPVVVGIDGSVGATRTVGWAAEVASQRQRRLELLHALDIAATRSALGIYDLIAPPLTDTIRAHGTELLSTAATAAREVDPQLDIELSISDVSPARALIERSSTAHLMVIGASGVDGALAHLGSTLLAVASHGHSGVVVVRGAGPAKIARREGPVVVGVDGSALGAAAVGVAFAEAAERATRLVAVHTWSDLSFDRFGDMPEIIRDEEVRVEAEAVLAEQLAGWQEKFPDVEVVRKVYLSGPQLRLLAWSKAAQLVVVGSRGRGGFRGLLLGSTSNSLVQHADCPVMVVHPAPGTTAADT